MNILAFDTSTRVLSVGVRSGEGQFVAITGDESRHAEALFPLIEACLAAASVPVGAIDLVACALGPGSFMGLRIGMSAAKGFALARGLPWIGVPTLDFLARAYSTSSGTETIVPVIDARKARLYAAFYSGGRRMGEYLDIAPAELIGMADRWEKVRFVGPDAELLEPYLEHRPGITVEPRAAAAEVEALALLAREAWDRGELMRPEAEPLYLREPEIG